MWKTANYDEAWERAWDEATEFERRRYRSLDWKGGIGVLMLVAGEPGRSLGEAIKTAAPFAADWTGDSASPIPSFLATLAVFLPSFAGGRERHRGGGPYTRRVRGR